MLEEQVIGFNNHALAGRYVTKLSIRKKTQIFGIEHVAEAFVALAGQNRKHKNIVNVAILDLDHVLFIFPALGIQ